MDWLPLPADFNRALLEIKSQEDPGEQIECMTRLASCQLTYLEAIQLDTAVRQIRSEPENDGLAVVNVAIVGSSTFGHLLPGLRLAGLRHRLCINMFAGSFGQYRQELLQPSQALQAFAPDFLIVSTSAIELLASVSPNSSEESVTQHLESFVEEIRTLWRSAGEHLGVQIIQQSILNTSTPLLGSFDRYVPGAPSSVIRKGNELLAEAAAQEKTLWLDIDSHAALFGSAHWFDATRWYQGKMEISPNAAMEYGELAVRVIGAQMGESRKCMVLDLDNTLWGGVIGDDGLEGIVLGQGSALGEAHLAIQQYAKSLSEVGVILAVCSKNDESTARRVFEQHPEMLLSLTDIAAFVANWQDKAENLVSIARDLNIGLDALVFIDDNPFERSRVREGLPSVAVPELPEDPAGFVPRIASAGYFDVVSLTTDDQVRARQYRQNIRRNELRDHSSSMNEFLRSLNMSTSFGQVDSVSLARATQLINKTNQFNATTQRMTERQVEKLADLAGGIVYQFRLSDRFGDNGIVSIILLRPSDDSAQKLEIVNWVMSCRVFGRQFEHEIMNVIVDTVRQQGIRYLNGVYIPTERNGVIKTLYDRLGFDQIDDGADGSTHWELDVDTYESQETFIKRMSL